MIRSWLDSIMNIASFVRRSVAGTLRDEDINLENWSRQETRSRYNVKNGHVSLRIACEIKNVNFKICVIQLLNGDRVTILFGSLIELIIFYKIHLKIVVSTATSLGANAFDQTECALSPLKILHTFIFANTYKSFHSINCVFCSESVG